MDYFTLNFIAVIVTMVLCHELAKKTTGMTKAFLEAGTALSFLGILALIAMEIISSINQTSC
jgi:hypothetical protein